MRESTDHRLTIDLTPVAVERRQHYENYINGTDAGRAPNACWDTEVPVQHWALLIGGI